MGAEPRDLQRAREAPLADAVMAQPCVFVQVPLSPLAAVLHTIFYDLLPPPPLKEESFGCGVDCGGRFMRSPHYVSAHVRGLGACQSQPPPQGFLRKPHGDIEPKK